MNLWRHWNDCELNQAVSIQSYGIIDMIHGTQLRKYNIYHMFHIVLYDLEKVFDRMARNSSDMYHSNM